MGKKILLIDDSAMLRRIAASVLGSQSAHYEVLAATRATEGFARACNSGVDLILADQRLSDLHGEELSERLLAEPRTARVPIVLMIGRGTPMPPLESLSANIVEILRKPFAPEQLVATVGAIIDLIGTGAGFYDLRATLHAPPRTDPAETPFRATVEETAPSWTFKANPPPATPGAPAPPAPRVDGAASENFVRGDSGEVSPRAALMQVARDNLTGVLRFQPPGAAPVEVFTDSGRILVVTTFDGPIYSDGAPQVLPPKVSPATLETAVHEQSRTGVPFFLTLGARGLLSKASAEALLHRFGQRYFSRLWTIRPTVLTSEFERMEALPGFVLRLEPRQESLDEWLLGTVRHIAIDEIEGLVRHEGCVGTPYFLPGGQTLLQSLPLTAAGREFAARVNGRDDLPTIAKALGVSVESAYLVLYRFRCLEAMAYRPAPAAFMVTPRTSLRRVLPLKR